ncbi:MAG TPA: M28 family peptidase, partial [Pirellulales bacterium]|nr:M28 family peptidase [Pirellulales bacterium]
MTPTLKRSTPNARESNVRIDVDYLRAMVRKLAFPRVVNTSANAVARQLIIDEFRAMHAAAPVVAGVLQNVYVGAPETATVLLGAHYDSVPGSPGADDNASAVAVLLAVARALAGHPNVIFAAFNSEEFGLAGSREFAATLPAMGLKLEAAYILEMVGYRDSRPHTQRNPLPFLQGVPTTADFLGVVTNHDALLDRILAAAGACAVPFVGIALPEVMANLNAV